MLSAVTSEIDNVEREWELVILPRQRAKVRLGADLMLSTLLLHPINSNRAQMYLMATVGLMG